MAEKRYYKDLRALAKRANQAMVRLEGLEIKSPAYQAAQAELEVLGRERVGGKRGRRFSETGKATWSEYEYQKRILENFLGMETRTQKGAKKWVEDVWQGAEENAELKLKETGVTKEEWFDFWESMKSKKERILGSEVYVRLLRTYTYKNRELSDDQKMSAGEIAQAIKEASNVKEAYKAVGITYKDVREVNSLGKL